MARPVKPAHPADDRRAAVIADPAGYAAAIRAYGRNNVVRVAVTRAKPAPAALLEAALTALVIEKQARADGATTAAIVYALPRDGGGHEVIDSAVWRGLAANHLQASQAAKIAAANNSKA